MRMTDKDLDAILKNGHCSVAGDVRSLKQEKPRVKSRKIEVDGHLFDSKAEALMYSEYKINPDVEILELHPRFIVLEPFKRKNKSYLGISYTSDFRIEERGHEIIVEVKSMGTMKANSKSYPMRRMLFLNKFPELNFREIIFDGKNRTQKDY
jgi:hypothetical protein